MRKVLLIGMIATFAGIICESESSACGRRHRARCCQPCEPCPASVEPYPVPFAEVCDASAAGVACRITCPDGCMAMIVGGVCRKACVDGALPKYVETKPTDKISLSAHDYPLAHLDATLGLVTVYKAKISKEMMKRRINLDVKQKTVPEIVKELGL